MKYYILYNPKAGNGQGAHIADRIEKRMQQDVIGVFDITQIADYVELLKEKSQCGLILCGGDGTLNRFVNDTQELHLKNEIFYYGGGTGNDFLNDIEGPADEVISITKYLQNLPICEINGKEYRFLNGVGFGLDGHCCQVRDEKGTEPDKKVSYTKIAVKALLFDYKTTDATVTVDGEVHQFQNVWIAPTMKGRFFGGGMMATPNQNRCHPEGEVSVLVLHDVGRLKLLRIFPLVFTGKHLKFRDAFHVYTGKEISVEFNEPRALQMDGEVHVDITKYSVRTEA